MRYVMLNLPLVSHANNLYVGTGNVQTERVHLNDRAAIKELDWRNFCIRSVFCKMVIRQLKSNH